MQYERKELGVKRNEKVKTKEIHKKKDKTEDEFKKIENTGYQKKTKDQTNTSRP